MATKDELDFAQLADSYDILGQVRSTHARDVVLATRKRDGRPMLISAYREPEGDAGNALNHLASDAKLLSRQSHPAIIPVFEARWIGNVLAVATDRVAAPSLAERIARRDEDFSFPRIAAILREINAVLEWSRERRVVNRLLGPDSVFVEEGSDSVRVMFVAQPLPANGVPDERDDARTIATLARAMMTRSVADPERDQLPLAELRPGLPSRVVQQTEALMGRADSIEPVDVRSYIAALAMSEELRTGEDECARVTREMSEEQRVTREQLAAERKAHEEDLAEQARKFAQEKEEILKTMAREREETARAMAKERDETAKAMAKERESSEKLLRQERERFEKEMQRQRSAFDREMEKQRAALEKERVRITKARERMERDRERFEKERAAAAAAMAAGAATASVPDAAASTAPAPTTAFERDQDLEEQVLPYEQVAERPVEPEPVAAHESASGGAVATEAPVREPAFAQRWAGGPSRGPRWRDKRVIGAAALVLLLVVAAASLAMGRRGENRATRTVAGNGDQPARIEDSISGLAAPSSPLDSAFRQDSISAESPVAPQPVARPVVRRPPRDTVVSQPTPVAEPAMVPMTTFQAPPADSVVVPALPFARTDTNARRDTSVRRDTILRRDSIVPRRDTMPAPPPDSAGARSTVR
jgi:hypothetical protein